MPAFDVGITICKSCLPHHSSTGRVVDVVRRSDVRQDTFKGGGDGRGGLSHQPLAPVGAVEDIPQVIRLLKRNRDMPQQVVITLVPQRPGEEAAAIMSLGDEPACIIKRGQWEPREEAVHLFVMVDAQDAWSIIHREGTQLKA